MPRRSQAFRKVVLPLSFPGVFAAVVLTFVPMTGDYINAQLLGRSPTVMIGQVIQQKFLTDHNYPEAAALSVMLMVAHAGRRADLRARARNRGLHARRRSRAVSADDR